jgi:hypothetical protein
VYAYAGHISNTPCDMHMSELACPHLIPPRRRCRHERPRTRLYDPYDCAAPR